MRMIPLLLVLALALPAPAQFQVTPAQTYGAPEKKKKEHVFGGFLSATRQMPPLPYLPFPDLPLTDVGNNTFVYDDRGVDYPALAAVAAAEQAKIEAEAGPLASVAGDGGGMSMMESSSAPILEIELMEDGGRRMAFCGQEGLRYRIEESTDLVNWALRSELVADDSTNTFYSWDTNAHQFFRVVEEDDRIQFPGWFDFIEQYLRFDVWTSIAGTYHLELYADGTLIHSRTQPVPANGLFGVYDGGYDPDQWPYTGYYSINDWELRVTVTPPAAGGGEPAPAPVQATVKKKGKRRQAGAEYVGLTVQQYGVVSGPAGAQDDLDTYMQTFFLANLQATVQIDLNGALLNEFTMPTPAIYGTNDWTLFRNQLTATNSSLDYVHYFGHGSKDLIGNAGAASSRVTLQQLQTSSLSTNPMTYVILDGCRSAEKPGLLQALIGYGKSYTQNEFKEKGWTPRFAAGWDKRKGVEYVAQGTLLHDHFYFWTDYYTYLTERDIGGTGYMFHTYRQAYAFAKTPNQLGVNPNIVNNTQATGFVPVGCYDCLFDQ